MMEEENVAENSGESPESQLEPQARGSVQRTAAQKRAIWFFQNRFRIFFLISLFFQATVILAVSFKPLRFEDDTIYDEIAFVSNVEVEDQETAPQEVAEGEIEPTDKKLEEEVDDRIASAQNPFQINATAPVDLNPDMKPPYTDEARAENYEGILYLEVVVANTGEVLMVRPRNQVGYGLERAAILTYRKKRFKPSLQNGSPITVKVIIPVRYRLK